MSKSRIVGIVVVGLVAAVALLLTVGIPSGAISSAIETRIARATGYSVAVTGTSKIGLFPGFNLTLNDVTLTDPNEPTPGHRIRIGSVRAEASLSSLLAGTPRVTELTLTRPEIQIPLIRDRKRVVNKPAADEPGTKPDTVIDHVTIKDGTVIMANAADGVEDRIDGINAAIAIDAERSVAATGAARLGGGPATFQIKAAPAGDAQPVPVELTFAAPDLLSGAIAAKAEVRLRGTLLQINGLSGTLGDGAFNGWASVDLAGKPRLKLDLDFQRIALGDAGSAPTPAGAPWSDTKFDLTGLNYLDAQIRLSAAELRLGAGQLAPASIDAKLSSGVLTAQFAQLGVYGGEASGQFAIDAAQRTPSLTFRADIKDVRARPLLAGLADFDRIDGTLRSELVLRADGDSARAMMSTLAGSAVVKLRDGEVRGVNIAQMIRALTTSTLTGWQDRSTEATDLTELNASFRIAQGKAETADLALAGPLVRMTGLGTIDLGAKALALKVEPKLVLTTQGQSAVPGSAAAEPVGLGIPVVIEGPWASPRIYPDTAGILDNPDAAYARLHQMGKGLFGALGGGTDGADNSLGGALGESIGKLIQQGLQNGNAKPQQPSPGSPPPPPAAADPTINAIMKQLFGR
ncbi:AsmA family protein [Rhodopseudomonas sp. HC1]|uniref:AsmA family protein n=1 Tax=Rhodopseudomonas infernalis TaxID=2897386 RepID=UPI001EE81C73|nr:AsmA family protein [Rhodopseudomonas infernalis]MCG6207294.1 AsmA family protein [Rhodopseudomonas infernalis]